MQSGKIGAALFVLFSLAPSLAAAQQTVTDNPCGELAAIEVAQQKGPDFLTSQILLVRCEIAVINGFAESLPAGDRRKGNLQKRSSRLTTKLYKMSGNQK